jgi:hypothetical protein
MLLLSTLLLALVSSGSDTLASARQRYRAVESYSVTLRSVSASETIRYYYKRPGYVRMEFVVPHKGAVLVYDPLKKEAVIRPLGLLKPLVIRLAPDNRLIMSSGGHRVDRSDIGYLLSLAEELRSEGSATVVGPGVVGGREAVHLRVEGGPRVVVAGGINRYSIWLDKELLLPIKVISYDVEGSVIEEVLMDDLKVNIGLTDDFFSL